MRVSAKRVENLLNKFIEMQAAPGPNPEQVATMFDKVCPYVPDEFKDNEDYAASSQDQIEASRRKKKERRTINVG